MIVNSFSPAIVVVAFNRPQSLERLLSSIDKSTYPKGEVPLCICIDYQDSDANRAVVRMAEDFVWNFGPKEVIHQTENLGLKAHVLKCGDLTERFGSIIMLEDDLFVSPAYYDYTVQALAFYKEDKKIGGISLYNHKMNFSNRLPFVPLADGADVYFLQIASSWGQAWTAKHWSEFRAWYKSNPTVEQDANMPDYIINWPDKSWLKHYTHYLSATKTFFVYPRISLSTNFGDAGQNSGQVNTYFQVPLLLNKTTDYRFVSSSGSIARYDAYFDLLPDCIKALNSKLVPLDFSNNLSGLKKIQKTTAKWVIVLGESNYSKYSFGLDLKPAELNMVHNINGKLISIVPIDKMDAALSRPDRKAIFEHYYGLITIQKKLKNIMDTILNKLF